MKRLRLLPLVFVLSFMMSGCGMMMMNNQQDDDFDQQQTINDTMDQQTGNDNGDDGS